MTLDWSGPIAVDCETTGLSAYKGDTLLGISLSDGKQSVYVQPTAPLIRRIAEHKGTVVTWNCLFDFSFYAREYPDDWHWPENVWDGMVAAWLMDENESLALKKRAKIVDPFAGDEQADLKRLMAAHCSFCQGTKSKKSKGVPICAACAEGHWVPKRSWADLSHQELEMYAAKDAELTWKMHEWQCLRMDPLELEAMDREMRVTKVVFGMTQRGILVDTGRVYAERAPLLAQAQDLAEKIPVNLGSPKQVAEWLTTEGVRLTRETSGGAVSTDRDSLLPHQKHECVRDLLEWRAVTKEAQFFDGLIEHLGTDGRVHPGFRPTGTVSGRFSCSNPNAQQWPRKGAVRQCLVPDPGRILLTGDLSQAELRVAASYARCQELIRMFQAGEDVYQRVADELGIERQPGKIVTLSSLYGTGARKLRLILLRAGLDYPERECKRFLNEYFALFPELRQLARMAEATAESRGYVRLIAPGRVRRFPFGHWKANPKDAINALVQGGVAESMKEWMLETDAPARNYGAELVLQVHDSCCWSVPSDCVAPWSKTAERVWARLNPFDVPIPIEWKEGV